MLCLGTIVFGWRAWRVRRRLLDAWPYAFVTAWWSTPIIGALVVSVLSTPIFVSRYLIVALPGLALAAAAFVVRLPRPIGVVVVGFVVVASAFGIAHQYDRPNQDFRGAEAYIASAVGPDDGIVMCPYLDWTPFAYYAASEPSARMPTPLDGIWPFSEMFGRGRQIGPHPKGDAVAGSIWVVSRASGLDETQRRNTCGMNHLLKQRVRTERIRFDEVTVERWAPND